jgi:uncharacterized protein YndB with AHSA1/START domain
MKASAEVVIERPVEAVWEWAADPRHWHRWQDGVGEVRLDDELGEGVRFKAALEYGGEHDELEYEIVERRRPRRQVVRSLEERATWVFEGTLELFEDVGGTRVRQTMDTGPGGAGALDRFLSVVARPLIQRSIRRRLTGQLQRLKTMVELEAAL